MAPRDHQKPGDLVATSYQISAWQGLSTELPPHLFTYSHQRGRGEGVLIPPRARQTAGTHYMLVM